MTVLGATSTRLTRLRRLVRHRRYRDAEGAVAVEGPHAIGTALDCGAEFEALYVSDGPATADVADLAAGAGVAVFEVERELLDDIADSRTPQGVLAVVRPVVAVLHDVVGCARVVLLDGVQDPGNAGAIVRTAAAAGFDAIIAGSATADLWGPKAIRASAGTIFAIAAAQRVETGEALEALGAAGHVRWAATADGETAHDDVEASDRLTLVLGSEAHGVSAAGLARIDRGVYIAMAAPVESLNVAVTAGVLLYQLRDR
ncbi:MAG: TrmH family RNA methyltransferase [Acidimicrobiales bacterium]|jgi:RNA methyltransferase, TrmH family